MRSEASTSQRLLAGVAHKAFRVPGFILIVDPTGGDGLEEMKQSFKENVKSGQKLDFKSQKSLVFYNHDKEPI